MDASADRQPDPARPDNIGPLERWISTAFGVGFALSAIRRGGFFGGVIRGAAAATLIARGTTGYCAVKDALTSDTTLKEGIREQWRRLATGFAAASAPGAQDIQPAEAEPNLDAGPTQEEIPGTRPH
jgi:hypothetical protein